jgi:hypothetical protein
MTGIATGPTTDWVAVPPSVPFRNRGSFWVGDKLLRRQPNLAICQDRKRRCVVLLFCDKRWNIRAGTSADSVSDAKQNAERYYPGLREHWISAGVTESLAKQYMRKLAAEHGCSFCGRGPSEIDTHFERRKVRICSSCVRGLHALLSKSAPSRSAAQQRVEADKAPSRRHNG